MLFTLMLIVLASHADTCACLGEQVRHVQWDGVCDLIQPWRSRSGGQAELRQLSRLPRAWYAGTMAALSTTFSVSTDRLSSTVTAHSTVQEVVPPKIARAIPAGCVRKTSSRIVPDVNGGNGQFTVGRPPCEITWSEEDKQKSLFDRFKEKLGSGGSGNGNR